MTPQEIEYALLRLNDRLKRVETLLALQPLPPGQPGATPAPDAKTPAPQAAPSAIRQAVPPQVPARPGNWLGIAAVVCFVVAAAFIVKLSIESGWLNPPRQIGLAALLGIALIAAGLTLRRTDREYASFLPAAGVIVLYLTTYAAHSLYSLLPFDIGVAVVAIVSAICIWLYIELKHDIYAITAAVGAYVSPAILDLSSLNANGEAVFALYYFLCCSVAFAAISIWLRTRTLTLVSAYLALLLTAVISSDLGNDGLAAGAMAVHFVLFAAGTWLYTRESRQPLTDVEAWSFLPVLIAFYAFEYQLLDRLLPALAPWISLGFAGLLIGLYLAARKLIATQLASQSLVLTYATVVAFHSGYLELLPEPVKPWLFAVVVLGIAFSPLATGTRPKGALWIPAAAAVVIAAVEYLRMLVGLFGTFDAYTLTVAAAAFASLWVLILRGTPARALGWNYAVLGLAHLLAIMGLYRLTAGIGSLAVSVSWLLYAVAVITFAFTRKDETMAKSALVVLALAAGKALLYDAASAPTVVRIVCLLLTGIVLYGCGLLMRRIAVWAAPPQESPKE